MKVFTRASLTLFLLAPLFVGSEEADECTQVCPFAGVNGTCPLALAHFNARFEFSHSPRASTTLRHALTKFRTSVRDASSRTLKMERVSATDSAVARAATDSFQVAVQTRIFAVMGDAVIPASLFAVVEAVAKKREKSAAVKSASERLPSGSASQYLSCSTWLWPHFFIAWSSKHHKTSALATFLHSCCWQ